MNGINVGVCARGFHRLASGQRRRTAYLILVTSANARDYSFLFFGEYKEPTLIN